MSAPPPPPSAAGLTPLDVESGAGPAPPALGWEAGEAEPLLSSAAAPPPSPPPQFLGAEDLLAPSGRSAGGDILAGLRALTVAPLASVGRAGGRAISSALPQGLKDGLSKGAEGFVGGLASGASAVRGGLVRTGDALAAVTPELVKDGLKAGAAAAQRGAAVLGEVTAAGAAVAKEAAAEGAASVLSVLPQEFKDVAAVSREAVEKLAEAGRAVERLLKDKAWRNYGGVKQGKKPFFNFYRVHFSYVMLTCLMFGMMMYFNDERPPNNFVDAIFMAISAMSGAGLTTVPMADITQFGLGCIFCLMLAGGITGLLIPPVLYRLWQYRQFKPMVQEVIALRKVIRARSSSAHPPAAAAAAADADASADAAAAPEAAPEADAEQEHDLIGDFELQDEGLQVLAIVLISYDLFFKFFGAIAIYIAVNSYGPMAALDNPTPPPRADLSDPVAVEFFSRKKSHAWFAIFTAVSSFNNVGFSILDDNYVQLADRPAALLIMCVLIVAGNTGLPIFLRGIFYILSLVRPNNRAIRFILDNPRRSTTAFFDRRQTLALTCILIGNLLIQYIVFLSTSMSRDAIKFTYDASYERTETDRDRLAVGGFFTSVSTRAAGMNVFDLRALSKANVVIFAIMMYIASAPFVGMMQASKQEVVAKYVNGELLLVYEGGEDDEDDSTQKSVMKKYLNSHLRWLVVFFFALSVSEQDVISRVPDPDSFPMCYSIANAPYLPPKSWHGRGNFGYPPITPIMPYLCATPSLFDICFEILSAYGTSGLSMGVPGQPYSLCGEFTDFGKIVLCAVKLMGKHRGLPSSTDAALDGQFHKIHGMLQQLQELGRKQREEWREAGAGEAGGEGPGGGARRLARGGYETLGAEEEEAEASIPEGTVFRAGG